MGAVLNIVLRTSVPLRRSAALVVTAMVLVAVGSSGCTLGADSGSQPSAPPAQVVAVSSIWADVVSNVACGRIRVASLIPAGTDSHDFEVTMRSADRLLRSKVVFANGLGLDSSLDPLFRRAEESGLEVVDLASLLPEGLRATDDDPHIWMDPRRVAALVPRIADVLDRTGLIESETIRQCAERYSRTLESLTSSMATRLETVPPGHRKLVSEHRNLGYFAQRFGFDVLGTMNDSANSLAEADARHLEKLRRLMRTAGISTVFVESGESTAGAKAFAADVSGDARVVGLHIESLPRRSSYVEMMRTNASRVATALAE